MIEHLETSADGKALRYKAGGKLTHEDYRALIPQLETAIASHGKISLQVELEGISGIEPRAILDEFAFDIRHFRDFDRLAVVGGEDWESWMTRLSDRLTPGDMRYFKTAEADAAWAWVQGG